MAPEALRLRPDDINPPAALLAVQGLVGAVSAHTTVIRGSISIVFADEGSTADRYISKNFAHFGDSLAQDFPELIAPNSGYRPLVYAVLSMTEAGILHGELIEITKHIRGNGICVALREMLLNLARDRGFSFLGGSHMDAATAVVFLKQGGVLLEELLEELQPRFNEIRKDLDAEGSFFTVHFANPQDMLASLKPGVPESIEERLELSAKKTLLRYLFKYIARIESKIGSEEERHGDQATLDEVLEDLEACLGITEISQSFTERATELKSHTDDILEKMSLERLKALFAAL